MTVDEFVQAEIIALRRFAAYYKEQRKDDPDGWPESNDYSDLLEQHDFSRNSLE